MGKIYFFLLLLLCSTGSFAQNRFLIPFYTAPDSSIILDYNGQYLLSYKQVGDYYTYYLSNIGSGTIQIIPYHKGFNRGLREGLIDEHPHIWVAPSSGAVIEGEPLDSTTDLSPLYEWDGHVLTKIADSVSHVDVGWLNVIFFKQDGPNSGLTTWSLGGAGAGAMLTKDPVYGAAISTFVHAAYSTGKNFYRYRFYNNTYLSDHLTPSNGDTTQPGYFYGISMSWDGVAYYLSHREGSPTRVHASYSDTDSSRVLFTQGDVDGHSDFSMEVTSPVMNRRYGTIGGINLTSPYRNNTRGDVYAVDRILGFHNVLHIQTGTDIEFARVVSVNPDGDIAVKTKGKGKEALYLISHDGSYNKKVVDSSTYWTWNDTGSWTTAIGPTLYIIRPDTAVVHYANPISKRGYTRNKTPIVAQDFVHSIGTINTDTSKTYSLQFVEIITRPSQGVLLDKNNKPIYNHTIISRQDLDTLKYSAGSFPVRDTFSYRAFDSVAWTNVAPIYINIVQAPDTLKPFERNTLEGTPIRFWASQFKQNYVGKLKAIRVNRLPAYGKLTIQGKQVFYERSRDISLEEIDSMYYTPYPNIVGVDTLQWMAYNDTALSKNDTPVILRVYPQLNTQPVLRTLKASYSQWGQPENILIANYPRPEAHTDVWVWIDGTQMLPVAADKTFVLSPSMYSAGTHQLKVTFKHKLDSISLIQNFTITGAPAPLMVGAGRHGITADDITGELTVLPNPFNGQFTVSGLSWDRSYLLRLYDAQGKLVFTDRSFNQSKKVLNAGNYAVTKGGYYLQVYDMQSKTVVKTIKLLRL
ncbi:T9SS type A sorting domain-containing protein [Chitinophaga sp. GbtcB8]|uniref:T9SS type A sorting domain-containing protein n=1 Tax=Chitinophaga sp. GbtcB8 TaxID=2824753 RepID=UPI001C2FC53B|nr:T9SS type A sorting domain-containing protein [Chitinophaga sp. GbtcB8]